jgi:hypothetical protein
MPAAYHDIYIEQGATFVKEIIWKDEDGNPFDLTGFTARMQIRRKKSSETSEYTATTENGSINLGDDAGTISILIPAIYTADFDFTKGVYDLELISYAGVVTRVLEGGVEVSKEVTR